ncbi:MAG TPA: flagellar hook-length control protein FliK [Arenibaculum sp.]|nr:flagellar hook-length control protein FliK [Arenibaculum sp.]
MDSAVESVMAAAPAGMQAVAGSSGPVPGIPPVPAGPGAGGPAGQAAGEMAGERAGEADGQPAADAGSSARTAEVKGPVLRVRVDQPNGGGGSGGDGGPSGRPASSSVDLPAAGATKGPAAFLMPAAAQYAVQSPVGGPDIGPATGPATGLRANVPAAAMQVAEQLVRVVQPGRNHFQIDLTPAELGRVRIAADVTEGRVTLLVQAERAETLDLLRADVRVLERALGDAGLKFDPASVQFSLRGDDQPRGFSMSGGAAQDRHRDGGDGAPGGHRPDAGETAAEPIRVAIDGIVDLMV